MKLKKGLHQGVKFHYVSEMIEVVNLALLQREGEKLIDVNIFLRKQFLNNVK
ncbi:MAG: hypothetical protein IPH33_18350 [Bacteroidetes bacterium]|nr:hypothetical protein [Bacteroidota bacterium]